MKFILRYIKILVLVVLTFIVGDSTGRTIVSKIEFDAKYDSTILDTTQFFLLLRHGYSYGRDQNDLYFFYAKKAYDLAKKMEYDNGIIVALGSISSFYLRSGKLAESEELALEALVIAENEDLERAKSKILNLLGRISRKYSAFEEALDYYFRALSIAEKNNYPKLMLKLYNNIAIVYAELDSDEEAIKHFRYVINMSREIGDSSSMFFAYSNMATLVDKKGGRLALAKSLFDTATTISAQFSVANDLAIWNNNLALISQKEGDYEMAYEFIIKAIREARNQGNTYMEAMIFSTLATHYIQTNEFDSALHYFTKSNSISRRINTNYVMIDNFAGMAKVYQSYNNYEKTLFYLKRSRELKDSIIGEQLSAKLSDFENRFNRVKQKKEIELVQEKERSNLLAIIGLIVVLLLIIILLYMLLNRNRIKHKITEEENEKLEMNNEILAFRKIRQEEEQQRLKKEIEYKVHIRKVNEKQLNAELEQKKRELSSSTMQVQQKNALLNEVGKRMEELLKNSSEENIESIRDIIKELDESIDLAEDWKNVKVHFEQV